MPNPEIEINVPIEVLGVDVGVGLKYDGNKIFIKIDLKDLFSHGKKMVHHRRK